jgi:cell volume regulation protein A
MDFIVPYNSAAVGKPVMELRLPDQSVITLVSRDNEYVVPTGATRLQGGDVLLIILNKASVPEVHRALSTPKRE